VSSALEVFLRRCAV